MSPKSRGKPYGYGRRTREVDWRSVGLRDFKAGRFAKAIDAWSNLAKSDAQVAHALAEAYFRRSLIRAEHSQKRADLQCALELNPDDMRYQYHLGLALHHEKLLSEAITCYRTVLENDTSIKGVGMVLALAELEQNPHVDITTLPGYTPDIHAKLAPVIKMVRAEAGQIRLSNKPDALKQYDQALSDLWVGLSQLQAKNPHAAIKTFSNNDSLKSRQALAIQRYYKGVATAMVNDVDKAFALWEDARNRYEFAPPWLQNNLSFVYYQRIKASLEENNIPRAVHLAQDAFQACSSTNAALNELQVYVLDRAAHAAAEKGEWKKAIRYWEDARNIISSSNTLGSPRAMIHNMALAYEAEERWIEAADTWRAMLRTRPTQKKTAKKTASKKKTRKAAAEEQPAETELPPADSVTTTGVPGDAQWAWIRKRVIECYQRAGEPGEAVKVFRQAVKKEPKNLDLRIQLVDALMANQQEQAALNEVERIVDIDPNYVEAHLRSANIYGSMNQWGAAEESLRTVLAQQPEREDVRREIANLLLKRGYNYHTYGMYDAAAKLFEEGQQFAPDNYIFPLNLARVAIDQRNIRKASSLLEQVLELGADNPDAYIMVIDCWTVAGKIDEAEAVLARAEENLTLTSDFYLTLGVNVLRLLKPRRDPLAMIFGGEESKDVANELKSIWQTFAIKVFDRVVAQDPENPKVLLQVISEIMFLHPETALIYAEKGVALAPDEPSGLLMLGIIQGLTNEVKEAKKTLVKAARLAKKQGLHELADQANTLRREIDSPYFRISMEMGGMFPDLDFDSDDLFF